MRGRDGRSGAFSLTEEGRMTRVDTAGFSLLNARVLVSLPCPFPCSRPHSSLPHSLLILYFGSLTSPFSTIPPLPVFMSLCVFSLALFLSSLAQHQVKTFCPYISLPPPPILCPCLAVSQVKGNIEWLWLGLDYFLSWCVIVCVCGCGRSDRMALVRLLLSYLCLILTSRFPNTLTLQYFSLFHRV